jgi:hypothetical protein
MRKAPSLFAYRYRRLKARPIIQLITKKATIIPGTTMLPLTPLLQSAPATRTTHTSTKKPRKNLSRDRKESARPDLPGVPLEVESPVGYPGLG